MIVFLNSPHPSLPFFRSRSLDVITNWLHVAHVFRRIGLIYSSGRGAVVMDDASSPLKNKRVPLITSSERLKLPTFKFASLIAHTCSLNASIRAATVSVTVD